MKISAKFRLPPYAILLPLVPVLQLAAVNIDRAALVDTVWIGLAVLAGYLAITLIFRALFRKPDISDPIIAAVYSAVFLPIVFLAPGSPKLVWLAGWVFVIILLVAWKEARRLLPIVFSAASAALLLFYALPLLTTDIWRNRDQIRGVAAGAFDAVPAPASQPANKPDIYYLVFDRYQRADYLKKIYNFDNASFLDALRKRGFVIVDEAYANYQRTAHSVVSSLNFDYLDKLETIETQGSADWYPLFEMFQDFRIGRFLKSLGYKLHFYGTWWEPTRRIGIADQNHTFYDVPEMARVIYEYSLLVDIAHWTGLRQMDPLYWQCRRSQLMFDDLRDGAGAEGPQFHFAHFLVPHPPFVTHETGRCMETTEALKRTRAENYGGQVAYTNSEILATVDKLLAAPGPKPIIILQADEGPWPEQFANNETTLLGRDVLSVDWQKVPAETLREKMAILTAIYAPEIPAQEIDSRLSPVNIFRKVLKSYFNVAIEPLPDRHKIYLDGSHIYDFKDVTDVLYGAPDSSENEGAQLPSDFRHALN
jgi:hypothetical protein